VDHRGARVAASARSTFGGASPPRSRRPRPADGRALNRLATAVLAASLGLSSPGNAAPDIDASSIRESYAPEDFDRFAPRTALDMARQVPGFPIDQGDGDRGFGQADTNILINGRRISGK